ncbi:Sodium:solute symporter family protein [Fulvivirga imtechensis AK7]|uniref:Sodium:solute symporter family protein n=1 Tax=Fulvivirga imtechensis AK7 TaxID=1237149 RepID=L8JRT1_9BACT|nr:sodium:solute symporter family protein [Fulvivirga imtechensis]ELR71570.1 Sodium:solute symporter family protein [Fulvivirga imtechensis AK7]
MELALIDYIIIISFFLISLAIGLWFRKEAGKDISHFFLGGRNLPWYIAGISMVATTFAADTPLAVTELVAQNGVAGNWLWWNMLAGGMLTTFFFAKYWRRADVLTDIEFIELRYSGKAARFLRGFRALYFGVFMNVLIIGWVNVALMSLLQIFFDIPQNELLWYVAGAMLIVVVYSAMSGLLGVAFTDVIQFVIAMTGSIILAIIVVNSDKVGGIDNLKASLPEGTLNFFPKIGSEGGGSMLALGLGSFLAFIGFQWWASWYPGAEPGGGGYIAQRMMSTKTEKDAVYSTLFFQIAHYCIRPWPWILVALCAIILYPELSATDSKLGYVMAMKDFLPTGLKGLLLVAFFAAYMSTISTQLNWGTSYLINDFYKRFISPQAGQKQFVMASRIGTLLLMLIALFVTSLINTISGVWSFIIECGAGLGLVMILRWYWWRINAWSEIVATVAPFIGYGLSKFVFVQLDESWGKGLGEDPRSFFFTVAFTTVAWIVATYVSKPTDEKHLRAFFDKIKPDGNWRPFRAEKHGQRLMKLIICWLSAIAMAYSALFLTGSFIFKEWNEGIIYSTICIVSFVVLRYTAGKVRIFSDKQS